MIEVFEEFADILVSGLTKIANGIGDGIGAYVQKLFLEVNAEGQVQGLSTFGGVMAIFIGLSLTFGLTRLIFNWVSSIGN